MQQLKWRAYVCCVGPLDRHGGSFKLRSLDRSQKVATWLIDSQGAQAWNKGLLYASCNQIIKKKLLRTFLEIFLRST